jgi:hypothetical protein
MQTWIEFFIILGKIFFSILVGILVAIVLLPIKQRLDKSSEVDEPEPTKATPTVYTYDRKGRLIERGVGK